MLPDGQSRGCDAGPGAIERSAARAGVKILLDECVPLPLRKILDLHTCRTAQQMGWKNIRNGELLDQIRQAVDSIRPIEFRRLEIPK
jgi:hypothetical protein